MLNRVKYFITHILCNIYIRKCFNKPSNFIIILTFLFGCFYLIFTSIIDKEITVYTNHFENTEANFKEFESIQTTDAIWVPVNGKKAKLFIYSAYYERRNFSSIRIIAISNHINKPESVLCRFWYEDQNGESIMDSKLIHGYTKIIEENWNLPYSAAFVICPMNKNDSNIPNYVSILSFNETIAKNRLLIRNRNVNVDQIPFNIAICTLPQNHVYNSVISLIEFLELHSILGVTHFTFFNGTFDANVDCVLREYLNDNSNITIEILPWTLEINVVEDIGYNGIIAALNDCLYRNMYSHSHLIPLDLDEIIFPKNYRNLLDLISVLNKTKPHDAAFLVQNAFFYKEHPSSYFSYEPNYPISRHLFTLTKTRKKMHLNPHRERSRYICRPDRVIELGRHAIWKVYNGSVNNEPPSTALLHHYSNCEFGDNKCPNFSWEFDHSALKFKTPLIARTSKKYDFLQTYCNLSDIEPIEM